MSQTLPLQERHSAHSLPALVGVGRMTELTFLDDADIGREHFPFGRYVAGPLLEGEKVQPFLTLFDLPDGHRAFRITHERFATPEGVETDLRTHGALSFHIPQDMISLWGGRATVERFRGLPGETGVQLRVLPIIRPRASIIRWQGALPTMKAMAVGDGVTGTFGEHAIRLRLLTPRYWAVDIATDAVAGGWQYVSVESNRPGLLKRLADVIQGTLDALAAGYAPHMRCEDMLVAMGESEAMVPPLPGLRDTTNWPAEPSPVYVSGVRTAPDPA
jgi:hypothetical protein